MCVCILLLTSFIHYIYSCYYSTVKMSRSSTARNHSINNINPYIPVNIALQRRAVLQQPAVIVLTTFIYFL